MLFSSRHRYYSVSRSLESEEPAALEPFGLPAPATSPETEPQNLEAGNTNPPPKDLELKSESHKLQIEQSRKPPNSKVLDSSPWSSRPTASEQAEVLAAQITDLRLHCLMT